MNIGLLVVGGAILIGGVVIGVAACFAWAYHAMGMGDSE